MAAGVTRPLTQIPQAFFGETNQSRNGFHEKEGEKSWFWRGKKEGGNYWSCPVVGVGENAISTTFPTDVAFKIGSQIMREKVAIGKTL